MDIPTEHQALVLERIQQSNADPSKMLDWDEASKTLKPALAEMRLTFWLKLNYATITLVQALEDVAID